MVRAKSMLTLNVLMNGLLVGYLRKLPNGAMAFQYADVHATTAQKQQKKLPDF